MIATIQTYLFLLLALVVFAVEVFALVHAALQPAAAFISAGKRTKPFWLLVLGGVALLGFLALPPPLGVGFFGGFLSIILILPAAIYLADVRPAVRGYRGGQGRGGPRRPGGWGGGW